MTRRSVCLWVCGSLCVSSFFSGQGSFKLKNVEGNQRRLEGNRRRLEGNQRRLAGNRRRLEGNQRRLAGNRRRLEGNQRRLAGNRRRLEGRAVLWDRDFFLNFVKDRP